MSLGIGVHTNAASASTLSLTTSALTTSQGSGVIVGVTYQTNTFVSVSDSKSNASPIQIGTELGSGQRSQLFYFPSLMKAGANHTFTVTFSGSAGFCTVYVQEITATNGQGIVVQQVAGAQDAATPFGNASGITTTIADTALVSVGHWQAGGTTNPDTWTAGGSFASGDMTENQTAAATVLTGALCAKIVSAVGTYTPSWTATQATTADVHMAAFSEGNAFSVNGLWPLLVVS